MNAWKVKGRTVNTFPQAELVFAEGINCKKSWGELMGENVRTFNGSFMILKSLVYVKITSYINVCNVLCVPGGVLKTFKKM